MKTNKNDKRDPFEYEDFGTPSMYLWSVITVLSSIGVVILFALLIAGGVIAISGALNG